jgi:multiple sugar transport system substrate-binding protein
MTDANGAVPARRSALSQSANYGPNGFLNLYVEQIDRGWAMPRAITPAYPAITTAFQTAFGNIVNDADVQSEMDKGAQSVDQDIQNNNGYPIQ